MDSPHEFWELKPDHVVSDSGNPYDEYIGNYHILFDSVTKHDETRPDYQIHTKDHECVAHFHVHYLAQMYCATMTFMEDVTNDRGVGTGDITPQ